MAKLLYARGMVDIKSIHTAAVRSIPKQMRSPYLDLYVLARERERLEKEDYVFGKRGLARENRLKAIRRRMAKIQEETQQEPKGHSHSSPKKPLKKMSINY